MLQDFGNTCLIIGFSLVSMYMIDVSFIGDINKYSSGILQYIFVKIEHYQHKLLCSCQQ